MDYDGGIVCRGTTGRYYENIDSSETWRGHVVARLDSIARLPDNWDDEGAIVPTPQTMTSALRALQSVMPEAAPRPAVVPTGDGGVQFEWHEGGWNIEIEAEPDDTVTVWARSSDRERRIYGNIEDLGAEISEIIGSLAMAG